MDNTPDNLDTIYEQLEIECVDIEKRIKTIEMIVNAQGSEQLRDQSLQFLGQGIDFYGHEELLKKHRLKKLQNLYFLNMIDCTSDVLEKGSHFSIFYQILGFSTPGNLASIMIENIDEEPSITKEDFCISFFESFYESVTQNDPNFKNSFSSLSDNEHLIHQAKSHIRKTFDNIEFEEGEQRTKMLFNALNYLFTNSVIDKMLNLEQERAVQEILNSNPFKGENFLMFLLPLKDMLCQSLLQQKHY